MKKYLKSLGDEYFRDHLEHCVSIYLNDIIKKKFVKNSESRILLSTYLDTDFGACDFFKGGANHVPQSS